MRSYVIATALLVATVTVFAQGPNNPANFETAKAKMSATAEQRMNILKEFKTCVDAAADINALKECKSKEMEAMKALAPQKGSKKGTPARSGMGQ